MISMPSQLFLEDGEIFFDGGSIALVAKDETGKPWKLFLECDLRVNPETNTNYYHDWILFVNGGRIEKNSDTEKSWIRLIEEAEAEIIIMKIDDWDEEKKTFVFQDDVEKRQRAEKEGLAVGPFFERKSFLEKIHSAR